MLIYYVVTLNVFYRLQIYFHLYLNCIYLNNVGYFSFKNNKPTDRGGFCLNAIESTL